VIGICTDSTAQLPPLLVDRYGIEVVPVTVRIGEDEYLEGVDLDADSFYARFGRGPLPEVATSQPSPGQFALAYERLAERGATEILSVHIAAGLSAHQSPVPVRLLDSGTASFGVGCCVWVAADAVARGATLDEAAAVAEALVPSIGNVFVVGALDLLARGGRAPEIARPGTQRASAVPVLSLIAGEVKVLAQADGLDDSVRAMADYALDWQRNGVRANLNVAIGVADAAGQPLSDRLEALLRAEPTVGEIVHYRVGPSVGAHTGPGTAGAFFYPASPAR
jgi:DegV family protein with EDD domain